MEESKSSASKKSDKPVYIVIGDSGVGKTTFVRYILGDEVGDVLKENPGGVSVTEGANLYECTKFEPKFLVIDTQGTNDTKCSDNNAILKEILFGILTIKNFPLEVNGIIYLHDSN
jgi:GTPase SAR1 family protein